jgi:hypothetical protein
MFSMCSTEELVMKHHQVREDIDRIPTKDINRTNAVDNITIFTLCMVIWYESTTA